MNSLPASTLVGLGVGDPLDVVAAQLGLEHRLAVAHATQAQVADVRLAGDEGDRHLVAQLAPAQVGVEDEGELVGRAEAAGHRHRADDHRAGVLEEFLVLGPEGFGVVDGADRVRVAAVRPGARHFVEAELGSGGDDQVVVGQAVAAVEFEAVASASILVTALAMKAMPLRSSSGAICRMISSRLRQPTATQGLDGTNWK